MSDILHDEARERRHLEQAEAWHRAQRELAGIEAQRLVTL